MIPTSPAERLERRQEPRYRVVLPVILGDGVGWTRDVSATGAYFKLFDKPDRLPQQGSRIKLDFVLEHVNPDGPFNVACEGEILRVETAAAYVGVAVRISSYHFGTPEPPHASPWPAAALRRDYAPGRPAGTSAS